jgi:hypothetical protein
MTVASVVLERVAAEDSVAAASDGRFWRRRIR